jgi:Flp pilus assembly pilin Flp
MHSKKRLLGASGRNFCNKYPRREAMNRLLKQYVHITERSGQAMVEYSLILSLIALAALAGYTLMGTQIAALVNKLAAAL